MKKILSLFMLFVLCFILVGCDDDGPIPYNYDSYQARQNLEELGYTDKEIANGKIPLEFKTDEWWKKRGL